MQPKAKICHTIPGRMRLRIPEQRHNFSYFELVKHRLSQLEGISVTEISAKTTSVLIYHELDDAALLGLIKSIELFELEETDSQQPQQSRLLVDQAVETVKELDDTLKNISGGRLDIWGTLFTTLAGAGVVQTIRGKVSVPATTLLWYALGTLVFAKSRDLWDSNNDVQLTPSGVLSDDSNKM